MHFGGDPWLSISLWVANDGGGHVSLAMDERLSDFGVWNFHPLVNR